jgi:hypothetical protein
VSPNKRNFVHRSCRGRACVVPIADWVRNDPVLTTRGWLLRHYDPVSPGARGHAAASEHQGVSLMGLGKRGRLRVDQPTITA